jgi:hypothetical protein
MKNRVPATELRTSTLSKEWKKKSVLLCQRVVLLCFVHQLSLEPKIHILLVGAHYHFQAAIEMALHFLINLHLDNPVQSECS